MPRKLPSFHLSVEISATVEISGNIGIDRIGDMLPAQTHPVDYMSNVRHTHSNILLSELDNVRTDTKEAFCEQHKLRCGYQILPNDFANDELGSALP